MDALKIAVIGGGSTYTPELVEGFLAGEIPVREIALMDIDPEKLGIVGGLAQRMAQAAGGRVPVTLTTDRAEALTGAQVVVTQFRVGALPARILDERIPLRHGLVGQETTGPGGFLKSLRTIPVILDINREMAACCPGAWLINFTNPSGLITEALNRHGQGNYVGLCNYPLTLKMNIARALQVPETSISLAYFGLNHLSWTRVLVDGEDRTDALIEIMIENPAFHTVSGYAFDPARLRALGLIPSGYLRYYYDTEKMVREMQAAPQTRGEHVHDVERELLVQYANPTLTEKPAGLQERGGAWYSTAAVRLVRDLWSATGGTHVLNVRNNGAMNILPDDVVVEVPAHVAHGQIESDVVVTGDPAQVAGYPIPNEVLTLISRVKQYELLAVQAAVDGSRELAVAALSEHPLLDGRHDEISALIDELLLAHRAYLPRFFAA